MALIVRMSAEAVKTATEKAGQLSILAEKSLTSAKEQEAENKKAKILLTQEKVRTETESKALKTLQSDLGKREAEIARKESILSQLKA